MPDLGATPRPTNGNANDDEDARARVPCRSGAAGIGREKMHGDEDARVRVPCRSGAAEIGRETMHGDEHARTRVPCRSGAAGIGRETMHGDEDARAWRTRAQGCRVVPGQPGSGEGQCTTMRTRAQGCRVIPGQPGTGEKQCNGGASSSARVRIRPMPGSAHLQRLQRPAAAVATAVDAAAAEHRGGAAVAEAARPRRPGVDSGLEGRAATQRTVVGSFSSAWDAERALCVAGPAIWHLGPGRPIEREGARRRGVFSAGAVCRGFA